MADAIPKTEPVSMIHAHRQRPRELAMSAAWHGAMQRLVTTNDGRTATVVYHGSWSNGFGPDFRDAMLDYGNGKLITGDIEIHTRASDWVHHGHNLDANYNNVILHIVSVNDLPETRCINGRIVPVAVLDVPDEALFAIDRNLPRLWHELGGSVCAEKLSKDEPHVIRTALHRLGDMRLLHKAIALEPEVLEHGASAAFIRGLFEAFGYSANKGPMRQLAELTLRYKLLEHPSLSRDETPNRWLVGVLLGLAGFLPLSPTDAHAGGILPEDQYLIERCWHDSAPGFADDFVPATAWQLARVRPMNHPVYRIVQLATLLTRTEGEPLTPLLETLTSGNDPVQWLQAGTARPWHPGLGAGRATAIVASVLLPVAKAIAATFPDPELEDSAARCWAELRQAEWTQPAKRALRQVTGGPGIRKLGERGHQGLLYLDRELCAPRNCAACPIAAAVMSDASAHISNE